MYISYFDETGDDGYPKYTTKLFVMTSIYMHYQNWKSNYEQIKEFRLYLKNRYNFPIKLEFHTNDFLLGKKPYTGMGITKDQKRIILFEFFDFLSSLDVKIINVVINKTKITDNYDVLGNAFTYNIQRIENDLKSIDPASRFMIITDEGRIEKMVKTARKIQAINYIPSKFGPLKYRNDIQKLIEDPLPKRSEDSYFIQLSDMVSFMVFLYAKRHFTHEKWAQRLKCIKPGDETDLLDMIKNILNLKASNTNDYGMVHYPK